VTTDEAIANSARLLSNAELETDLGRMERMQELAETWLAIAHLLSERDEGKV
jgi:hypothetical protein